MMKVALLFGLHGACRRDELCSLKVCDIVDSGSVLVVKLHDTKTKKKRVFTVTSDATADGVDGLCLYRNYLKLRPQNIEHGRFFIFYKSGKCTSQPVGINSFAIMPKKIAEFI